MTDITPKLPLTKKSFTQGDRAVFIRDTTIRLAEAVYRGGRPPYLTAAYAEAEAIWERFMEDLPND